MNRRILVVDDNELNLKLAKVLLAGAGFEVKTASDGHAAFETLQHWRPRLIVMDIQMPGIDGLELTRRIKADPALRDIIVVATTAYAMKGDELRMREAGCEGYIAKPIDTRTFTNQIAAHLPPEGQP